MSSEARRHQLYEEAKQVFSPDSADEFMSYFPPVGWADVATKADLVMLRNEMDALRAELRGETAELRGELRGETAELRSGLQAEMARGFGSIQRWTITTVIAMTGLFAAIAVGAARLGT